MCTQDDKYMNRSSRTTATDWYINKCVRCNAKVLRISCKSFIFSGFVFLQIVGSDLCYMYIFPSIFRALRFHCFRQSSSSTCRWGYITICKRITFAIVRTKSRFGWMVRGVSGEREREKDFCHLCTNSLKFTGTWMAFRFRFFGWNLDFSSLVHRTNAFLSFACLFLVGEPTQNRCGFIFIEFVYTFLAGSCNSIVLKRKFLRFSI